MLSIDPLNCADGVFAAAAHHAAMRLASSGRDAGVGGVLAANAGAAAAATDRARRLVGHVEEDVGDLRRACGAMSS